MQIFDDDYDYQVFISQMRYLFPKNNCTLHAYCLMTNHFHILLETSDIEISRIMKKLLHDYAMYYNKKNSYRGHLFENRYVSCIVEDDEYFVQIGRYIHLNPVKAHMVNAPELYKWSSYRTMIGMEDDGLTVRKRILDYFGQNAVFKYREFVENSSFQYEILENTIRKSIGEDELWLPW